MDVKKDHQHTTNSLYQEFTNKLNQASTYTKNEFDKSITPFIDKILENNAKFIDDHLTQASTSIDGVRHLKWRNDKEIPYENQIIKQYHHNNLDGNDFVVSENLEKLIEILGPYLNENGNNPKLLYKIENIDDEREQQDNKMKSIVVYDEQDDEDDDVFNNGEDVGDVKEVAVNDITNNNKLNSTQPKTQFTKQKTDNIGMDLQNNLNFNRNHFNYNKSGVVATKLEMMMLNGRQNYIHWAKMTPNKFKRFLKQIILAHTSKFHTIDIPSRKRDNQPQLKNLFSLNDKYSNNQFSPFHSKDNDYDPKWDVLVEKHLQDEDGQNLNKDVNLNRKMKIKRETIFLNPKSLPSYKGQQEVKTKTTINGTTTNGEQTEKPKSIMNLNPSVYPGVIVQNPNLLKYDERANTNLMNNDAFVVPRGQIEKYKEQKDEKITNTR